MLNGRELALSSDMQLRNPSRSKQKQVKSRSRQPGWALSMGNALRTTTTPSRPTAPRCTREQRKTRSQSRIWDPNYSGSPRKGSLLRDSGGLNRAGRGSFILGGAGVFADEGGYDGFAKSGGW